MCKYTIYIKLEIPRDYEEGQVRVGTSVTQDRRYYYLIETVKNLKYIVS